MHHHDHPLGAAMRNAGVDRLDERGLMPLEEARALVRGVREFRRGGLRIVAGRAVLDSDRLWAALLSLEDAHEFVVEASRIEWFFHPRGDANVEPILRYGAGIQPWLETFVHADGRLVNVPWCVVPCMLETGDEDFFRKLWSVRTVVQADAGPGPGPFAADSPGDVDTTHALPPAPSTPPPTADASANGLVLQWIWTAPAQRFPMLARFADNGDGRARVLLKSLAQAAPSAVFGFVRDALGDADAVRIFEASSAPRSLDEPSVLAVLDGAARSAGLWPVFYANEPDEAYIGMRLVAFREREGDGWQVCIQRAEGSFDETARTRLFVFGSVHGPGWLSDAMSPLGVFEEDDDESDPASVDLDDTTVVGPRRPVPLSNADHEALDLRARHMTAPHVRGPRFTVLARAYLARFPGAYFQSAEEVAELLGVEPPDWQLIASTDAFHHVVGTAAPQAPYDDGAWRVLPSTGA
jgi:hypothetical protein